jgi:uncharacterized protein involved in exopolysaccharide biosynthesis
LQQGLTKKEILYNIFFTLLKRKKLLFGVFTVTFSAILLGTFLVTPVWKATALIMVEPNPKQQMIIFENMATPRAEPSTVNPALNMIQVLTSRGMAEKIIKDFGLDKIAEEKAKRPKKLRDKIKKVMVDVGITYPTDFLIWLGILPPGEKNFLADAIDDFMDETEDIELEEDTSVINLSIWGESPKMARDIANKMANLLIEKTLYLTQSEAKGAYDFVTTRVTTAEKDLKDVEEALRKYKEANSIVRIDEEAKVKINKLADLEIDLGMAQIEKKETEERIKDVKRQLSEQKETIIGSDIVASIPYFDELKNTLKDLEVRMASLLTEKTREHPDVISLKASIDEVKKKLKEEAEIILQKQTKPMSPFFQDLTSRLVSLEIDRVALTAKEYGLEQIVSKAKKELNAIPGKELELERLTREVTIKQGIYQNLKTKEEELSILKDNVINELSLKIIDEAYVYDDVDQDWPMWILNIPVGFIVSLACALGVVFFVEYWNDSFRTSRDIKVDRTLFLGSVPYIKRKNV